MSSSIEFTHSLKLAVPVQTVMAIGISKHRQNAIYCLQYNVIKVYIFSSNAAEMCMLNVLLLLQLCIVVGCIITTTRYCSVLLGHILLCSVVCAII